VSFLRETWIVFSRALRLSLRNPVWVVIGLTQPVLYLALFGPLLKKVVENTPGLPPGDAWQIFVPGLLVQLGIFGAAFVGFGLVAEWRAGVIERMRVTPAHRTALLAGRVARDVVVLLVQGALLMLVAVPFGLRVPVGGAALALLVVGLLAAAFSSLSYAAALALKSEDALAPLLNGIAVPVLLLSGILLPMSLAPAWLRTLSDVNPLKHVVDGIRAFFRGDLTTSVGGWGLVWALGLVAAGLLVGTRTFRRESA
jgi:ABC-2 type transport system permease protein